MVCKDSIKRRGTCSYVKKIYIPDALTSIFSCVFKWPAQRINTRRVRALLHMQHLKIIIISHNHTDIHPDKERERERDPTDTADEASEKKNRRKFLIEFSEKSLGERLSAAPPLPIESFLFVLSSVVSFYVSQYKIYIIDLAAKQTANKHLRINTNGMWIKLFWCLDKKNFINWTI